MNFKFILIEENSGKLSITLNRPQAHNALNSLILSEIDEALTIAEKSSCCYVLLSNVGNVFCSGMDLKEIDSSLTTDKTLLHKWPMQYMALLKRMIAFSKLIVCNVKGKVMAGGLGLVAASDIVLTDKQASFKLTESLWGLFPAVVAPFLIRRIGLQKSYYYAITSRQISAEEALNIGLVDIISEEIEKELDLLAKHFSKLDTQYIKRAKNYFEQFWCFDEKMEATALDTFRTLLGNKTVEQNIRNFVETGKLPWK